MGLLDKLRAKASPQTPASGPAKDPVCGMTVEPQSAAGTSQHKGQTIYFCSKSCKARFDADPAKYAR